MSSEAISQVQSRNATASRGRRGNRGRPYIPRSRQQAASAKAPQAGLPSHVDNAVTIEPATSTISQGTDEAGKAEEGPVCWICAEPVKYYSLSECNHRTCHVCALRLRALYKKTDCTFCKDPQPTVIFTVSPDALFSSYTPDSIPYKDSKLAIFFETSEMMEETLILLRFNCPLSDCDFIATGWSDLKLHVRASHGKVMCDLCIRFKKVFSHEHAVYAPNQLHLHLPSVLARPPKSMASEQIEGGTHPLCQFCRECFFGDDELFSHMRERHEECFVCKRNDIRDQYFQNYDNLDKHFNYAHHPCTQPQCLARKFVVFSSALDLKAHMVEEHGADMTSRDKKETRRIFADFEFEEVGAGRGGRGRRDRGGDREREREPPPRNIQTEGQPPSGGGPMRPNGNVRRREAFGAHLTTDGPSGQTLNNNATGPNRRQSPSPSREGADNINVERHAAFMARLQSLVTHQLALPAVKAAIRGYRASESSARDLISTVWNILDRSLDDTASVVVGLVDLFEEDDKKSDLLSSWNGFKIEQRRQFPGLVPSEVGAGYAGITSGRVLNAKHSTATRSSQQSSRQVWDRVAQAASTSSRPSSSLARPTPAPAPRPPDRPPPLQPPIVPIPGPAPVPAFRQAQRNTPWASSSASGVRAPSSVPVSSPAASRRELTHASSGQASAASSASGKQPPKLSNALFPELPTSSTARSKASVKGNVSLRNIVGDSTPAVPAWKAGAGSANGANENSHAAGQGASDEAGDVGAGSGKGKKGKGKQKQMLFTLGSFPT